MRHWPQEELKAAELRLNLKPSNILPRRRLYTVSVLEVVSARRGEAPVLRTLDTKRVDAGDSVSEGWYTMDVLPAVARWASEHPTVLIYTDDGGDGNSRMKRDTIPRRK